MLDYAVIVRGTPPLPSSAQLRAFEKELGFTLPNDYFQFLLATNGGKVTREHQIPLQALGEDTCVDYFYPLSVASPSIGLIERRQIQMTFRQGLRPSLIIGDDMGPGVFFLVLAGQQKGSVCFCFKDEIPTCECDWYTEAIRIPEEMEIVCDSFSGLCKLILGL